MKGTLKKFLGKGNVKERLELSAHDARLISDNFSCLQRAFARIRRKANLGLNEVRAPHLSKLDVAELKKLGYTVDKDDEGFKIIW